MPTPKLASWYTKTRINRIVYLLLDIGFFVALLALVVVAFMNISDGNIRNFVVVILSLIYFGARLLLIRFRLNDIPPETQIGLAQKGLLSVFGNWMLYLAPSDQKRGSSFANTRDFYLNGGKPNMKIVFKNIGLAFIIVAVLTIITLFLRNILK